MALICAVGYGHTGCVRLLLESGADKDSENDVRVPRISMLLSSKTFEIACKSTARGDYLQNIYFLQQTLYKCLCQTQDGETALICAAAKGRAACLRLLLDSGAELEARSNVRGVIWWHPCGIPVCNIIFN